jgi:hypothetical protein
MNSILITLFSITFFLGWAILFVGCWWGWIFLSGKSKNLIIFLSVCFLGISVQNSMAHNPDPPLYGGAAHRSDSYSGMKHEFRGRLDALYAAMPGTYKRGFAVVSGYRSEHLQNQLRHHPHKRGYVAMGTSHHTIGDAADVKASPGCFHWMRGHARQFGLFFPMIWEKWHIQTDPRYRGRQFAEDTPLDLLASLFGK